MRAGPRMPTRQADGRSQMLRANRRPLALRASAVSVAMAVGLGLGSCSAPPQGTQHASATSTTAMPTATADSLGSGALNIIVIGSDVRDSDDPAVEGMRSDTTMVVHISADRQRVDVVSIPRDSLVTVPACDTGDGSPSQPQERVKFNSAFATGGQAGDAALAAACTTATIESATGIHPDGWVVADFAGFAGVVDAVGGVEMTLEEPVTDTLTGFSVPAGTATFDGDTALAYVRARHVRGSDGSDIGRIDRQQQFVGALTRTVMSPEVMTSPTALARLWMSASDSLTLSDTLSSPLQVARLGWTLRSMDTTDIRFLTTPWVEAGDRSSVVWTSKADTLWKQLSADQPVAEVFATRDGAGNSHPAGS